jgi:hypothetical protein
MKTSTNNNHAIRMATTLLVALVFGAAASAQTNIITNTKAADEAQKRLDALMVSSEEAVRYVAQSFETVGYDEAIDRLEVLASNTENEIRYQVPEEGQVNSAEYALSENNTEEEASDFWQTLFLAQIIGK